MLTLFPTLLTYQMIAPFLLRMALVLVVFWQNFNLINIEGGLIAGWKVVPNKLKVVLVAQKLVSLLLLVGLFTQLAAALYIVMLIIREYVAKTVNPGWADQALWLISIATCLSLMVLGPGIFSIDLPL
jgi:uncharacterized membrane protein YphA (DoxX/SURF4 family)